MSGMDMSAMAESTYGYLTATSYPNSYKDVMSQRVGENDVNRIPTYTVSDSRPDSAATMPSLGLGHASIGHSNPLFWLLVIALLVTGYVGFVFDFDFKKLGEARIGLGNKK